METVNKGTTGEKRNKWLDIDLDEEDQDDEQGYDSEAAERRKGARRLVEPSRRTTKRRKLDHNETSEQEEEEEEEEEAESESEDVSDDDDVNPQDTAPSSPSAVLKPPTQDHTNPNRKPLPTPTQPPAHKTGVIYISRIPPFMKPRKLRSLLSPYGGINRIFLTPEDGTRHSARVRQGGNKKRSFVDGWVEFVSKRDAKMVAETLNTQTIGGKKGGFYHDDVWNVKYLRGFKWAHLTEQIANENAERAARLRSEIARARREDREFVGNVARAKMLGGMSRKRGEREEGEEGPRRRVFRQREVRARRDGEGDGEGVEGEETVRRVLRKIF